MAMAKPQTMAVWMMIGARTTAKMWRAMMLQVD